MLLSAMIYIGILIFIPSMYLLIKNYKCGRYIKIYGTLCYYGLFITHLGIILSMESVFTRLPWPLSGKLPFFITIVVFEILYILLRKPTFLKEK